MASKTAIAPLSESVDYAETRSVQLEWKVNNLRQLFDSTKGEAKSKCVKSSLFDEGRWQIFLYPNSGQEQYVSIYLSAEPTPAERERGLAEQAAALPASTQGPTAGAAATSGSGKEKTPWRREGHYKFTFELRSLDRRVTFKTMEPDDNHAFNSSYRNWGYAQMISRRDAYYNNAAARAADAFLVICTIVSTPTLPTSPPPATHTSIPKTLVSAYASLFDDPDYSDVVFRIRPEKVEGRRRKVKEKRLFAAKKILAGRSEYFEMMFSSGFSEGSLPPSSTTSTSTSRRLASSSRRPRPSSAVNELDDEGELSPSDGEDGLFSSGDESSSGETDPGWDEDDDSDPAGDEGEQVETEYEDGPDSAQEGTPKIAFPTTSAGPVMSPLSAPSPAHQAPASPDAARARRSRTSSASLTDTDDEGKEGEAESTQSTTGSVRTAFEGDEGASFARNATAVEGQDGPTPPPTMASSSASTVVGPGTSAAPFVDALSTPASPIKSCIGGGSQRRRSGIGKKEKEKRSGTGGKHLRGDGRARFEVVVTDAAWSTYRSLLYYLYTDTITFSPLASTFYSAREAASSSGTTFPWATRREYLLAQTSGGAEGTGGKGGVGPASAKAIYRLADKMDLVELKGRAYEHVVGSLTAENIVYEVFGSFSQRFDEIRQVEIAFLLQHWNTVRTSPQMRLVFDYLRTGRFPGFEDVWIELVQNLEVRAGPPAFLSTGITGGQTGAAEQVQGGHGREDAD
ncbi:hypothetical protein JCM11251_003157 [Rhodosporidiobolus azoricus]